MQRRGGATAAFRAELDPTKRVPESGELHAVDDLAKFHCDESGHGRAGPANRNGCDFLTKKRGRGRRLRE
jgi:hypothetical protein